MAKKIQMTAGVLQASKNSRTVTGLLVPFGVTGKTNLGKLKIRKGSIRIPKDLTGVTLNIEHNRERPVGAMLAARETPKGIVGTFKFANTPEGDRALQEARAGIRKYLSIEATIGQIQNGVAMNGKLFAAAVVRKPAFQGASLMAAEYNETEEDVDIEEIVDEFVADEEVVVEDSFEEEFTDENGVVWVRKTETVVTEDEDGGETHITVSEDIPTDEVVEEQEEEEPVLSARVPQPLRPQSRRSAPPRNRGMDLKSLYATLAQYSLTRDSNLLNRIYDEGKKAATLYAALTDVKGTGTGGVASTISLPQWLGELWSGRTYDRRYIPLFDTGELTNFVVEGYKFTTKPEVDEWSGNKTNVPSGSVGFTPYNVEAKGYAGAHDIDRRLRDFEYPQFWESYFGAMTDSYAEKSDRGAFDQIVAAATEVERGNVPTDVAPGLVSIVDGALAILDVGLPTFAVVAKNVWRDLLLTPKDKTVEYLSSALSLEEGSLEGFKIVPAFGDDLTDDQVLVGNRHAAQVLELPGSPIRVEGLDMVKGGIDPGVFGYAATVIHEATALALVEPPAEEEQEEG